MLKKEPGTLLYVIPLDKNEILYRSQDAGIEVGFSVATETPCWFCQRKKYDRISLLKFKDGESVSQAYEIESKISFCPVERKDKPDLRVPLCQICRAILITAAKTWMKNKEKQL